MKTLKLIQGRREIAEDLSNVSHFAYLSLLLSYSIFLYLLPFECIDCYITSFLHTSIDSQQLYSACNLILNLFSRKDKVISC